LTVPARKLHGAAKVAHETKTTAAPPAPRGNQRSRKHGALARVSQAEHAAKVAEIEELVAGDAPVRGRGGGIPHHDRIEVSLLARCLVQMERAETYCAIHGFIDEKTGAVKPAAEHLARLRKEAARHLDALGMNPTARARLGLDLARTVDLATAMSERDPERRKKLLAEIEEAFDGA
jgi:hypothetical protein